MFIGTIQEIWRYPVKSMAGETLNECLVDSLGVPGDRGWAMRDEAKGEFTTGRRLPLAMQCAARYRQEPANGNVPHVDLFFPDGSTVGSDDAEVNARLSEVLGKTLTLWPRQPATDKKHYRRSGASARAIGYIRKLPGFQKMLPGILNLPTVQSTLHEAFSREPGEPVPDLSKLPTDLLEFTSPPGTYFDAFPIHVLTTASLRTMARFNPAADWDRRRFRANLIIETAEAVEGLPEAEWAGRTIRIGELELTCEVSTPRCGMTTQAQEGLAKDPSVLRSIVKEADQNLGIYASVVKSGRIAKGDRVELM